MRLKVIKETDSGLNTRFVNTETNRTFDLEYVLTQIDIKNPNYRNYQHVRVKNGNDYVRSIADKNTKNNIE